MPRHASFRLIEVRTSWDPELTSLVRLGAGQTLREALLPLLPPAFETRGMVAVDALHDADVVDHAAEHLADRARVLVIADCTAADLLTWKTAYANWLEEPDYVFRSLIGIETRAATVTGVELEDVLDLHTLLGAAPRCIVHIYRTASGQLGLVHATGIVLVSTRTAASVAMLPLLRDRPDPAPYPLRAAHLAISDPAGQTYVVEGNTLLCFGSDGRHLGRRAGVSCTDSCRSAILALGCTPDGTLTVVHQDGTAHAHPPVGPPRRLLLQAPGRTVRVDAAAVGPDGHVTFVDGQSGELLETQEGRPGIRCLGSGYERSEERRIAIDDVSNVYVLSPERGRIEVRTRSGDLQVAFGGFGPEPYRFQKPSAIAVPAPGRIVVADGTWLKVFRIRRGMDFGGRSP